MLDRQEKRHGKDYGLEHLAAQDGAIPLGDTKVTRAQVLILPGMKVKKQTTKEPTKRLRKAMGL